MSISTGMVRWFDKPVKKKAKKFTVGKGQKAAWIKFVTTKELGPWNASHVSMANMKWSFYAGYKAGRKAERKTR